MISTTEAPAGGSRRQAFWAFLISLLWPGLGLVYAGRWRFGASLVAIVVTLMLLLIEMTRHFDPSMGALGVLATLIVIGLCLGLLSGASAARAVRRSAPPKRPWVRSAWTIWLVSLFVIGLVRTFQPMRWRGFTTPSTAMTPTFETGDRVMVSTRTRATAQGDVVFFSKAGSVYVKRAIGLPGDRVALRDGVLFLNGVEASRRPNGNMTVVSSRGREFGRLFVEMLPGGHAYEILKLDSNPLTNDMAEAIVPPDMMFVLGDNRDNSTDSRFQEFGFVPLADVIAQNGSVYWSFDLARIFRRVN